jgi:hypothetical protein
MLPKADLLPHLICSRPISSAANDEAYQHDDARRICGGDCETICKGLLGQPAGMPAAPSRFTRISPAVPKQEGTDELTLASQIKRVGEHRPFLPYSTDGCSPAGCLAATARSVLMPLRLHGFADFANYQLPEIR